MAAQQSKCTRSKQPESRGRIGETFSRHHAEAGREQRLAQTAKPRRVAPAARGSSVFFRAPMTKARSKSGACASRGEGREQARNVARAVLSVAVDADDIIIASPLCVLDSHSHRAAYPEPLRERQPAHAKLRQ